MSRVTCRVPCHRRIDLCTPHRLSSLITPHAMDSDDENPRPTKRARSDALSSPLMPSSSLTPPPSSPVSATEVSSGSDVQLRPLPPAVLLVSLPALLAHPPNHRYYTQSLYLSLCSLRKCLTLQGLSPELECRAWTSLAEIGMRVIHGGIHENESHPWANHMVVEVRSTLDMLQCAYTHSCLGREGHKQRSELSPLHLICSPILTYTLQSIIAQKVLYISFTLVV